MTRGFGVAASTAGSAPFQTTSRFTLVVVPLFIFMGVLASHGRMAEDAFGLARKWFAWLPGNLAIASIASCAAFAAVSGSSVATAATIGRLSVREMQRHGYDTSFAVGVVGAAGTVGVLIPPSVVLVLYGIITGESIGALLIAGIVPGALSALLYAVAVVVMVIRRPAFVSSTPEPMVEGRPLTKAVDGTAKVDISTPSSRSTGVEDDGGSRQHIVGMLQIAVLFVIVIGGIYTGTFTATESAAVGALAALVILVLDRRGRGYRNARHTLIASVSEASSTSAFVFAIVIGAGIFTFFLVSAGVPSAFTAWAVGLPVPPMTLVIILLVAIGLLGMILDPFSILLIAVPMAYPVIAELGYDGIWFAILVVKAVEVGLVSPPVGINAFVIAGATGSSVEEAFRGVIRFIPVDVITIVLIFIFPGIATALPTFMRR